MSLNRKTLKTFILLIVFGVPVIWYLFLQLFGENQFELEVLGKLDSSCLSAQSTVFLLHKDYDMESQNQLRRLSTFLEDHDIILFKDSMNCFSIPEQPPLMLVDGENNLRGRYDITLKEIDRIMVEVDLLKSLENGTGN